MPIDPSVDSVSPLFCRCNCYEAHEHVMTSNRYEPYYKTIDKVIRPLEHGNLTWPMDELDAGCDLAVLQLDDARDKFRKNGRRDEPDTLRTGLRID